MERVSILYDLFKKKIPFSFIKLNDGECVAMDNPNQGIISRGDDVSSELMSQKLKESLNYEAPNYYVGLPCKNCRNHDYQIAMKYLTNPGNEDRFMNANILINSNTYNTYKLFQDYIGERKVIVISNATNLSNISKLERFNIKPYRTIEVAERNAFEKDYERVLEEWRTFNDDDIILCLCGPLGRVLCYEWFKSNPTLTCLEMGSFFDPFLKNRSYAYHTCNHAPCNGCFPMDHLSKEHLDFVNEIINNPEITNECYYSGGNETINFYFSMFYHNKDIVRRNTMIRLKKNPHDGFMQTLKRHLDDLDSGDIMLPYKRMNKSELYRAIEGLYYGKNYDHCNRVCDFYLSLFGKISEKDVRLVKFFRAFTCPNWFAKVGMYEEILCDPDIEDYLKNWCSYNVSVLYPRDTNPIPKIIHLIYLKVKDFQKYHARCISSISHFAPDYQIWMHNDIEPEGNPNWDHIKTLPNLQIKKISRRETFDDFPLRYVQYEADVIRLELLYEYGGIYFDTDILVVKPFDKIFEDNKSFYLSRETKNGGLINSFLASKPKNEFITLWLECFKSGLRMENWAYHIRESNNILLEKNPHYKIKYDVNIMEHVHFFPFPWNDYGAFDGTRDIVLDEETYGIHLFDTILHNILINNNFFGRYYNLDW